MSVAVVVESQAHFPRRMSPQGQCTEAERGSDGMPEVGLSIPLGCALKTVDDAFSPCVFCRSRKMA